MRFIGIGNVILTTNIAIAASFVGLAMVYGWRAVALVHLPIVLFAGVRCGQESVRDLSDSLPRVEHAPPARSTMAGCARVDRAAW